MASFHLTNYMFDNKNLNLTQLTDGLYKKGIMTKDYEEDNLMLFYNTYDKNNRNQLEEECRSVIINRTTREIICYTCNTPPCNFNALKLIMKNTEAELKFYKCYEGTLDRKSTRLNSSHSQQSRMPSSA